MIGERKIFRLTVKSKGYKDIKLFVGNYLKVQALSDFLTLRYRLKDFEMRHNGVVLYNPFLLTNYLIGDEYIITLHNLNENKHRFTSDIKKHFLFILPDKDINLDSFQLTKYQVDIQFDILI